MEYLSQSGWVLPRGAIMLFPDVAGGATSDWGSWTAYSLKDEVLRLPNMGAAQMMPIWLEDIGKKELLQCPRVEKALGRKVLVEVATGRDYSTDLEEILREKMLG
jgi:hypothetical protein